MCIVNAFRLWSTQHPAQNHLKFRETLMYEMTEQLRSEQTASAESAVAARGVPMAKDHYTDSVHELRDCVQCSGKDGVRRQTHHVCVECHKHMCMGACFGAYHKHLTYCSSSTPHDT
jgi:hypothetical protein